MNINCGTKFWLLVGTILTISFILTGCDFSGSDDEEDESNFPVIELPEGYQIERVATGLTYPTALAWDDDGEMYVAEAGGGLDPTQLAPSRILRVNDGSFEEVVNLTDQGVNASVVGLEWHNGELYFTHRNADDLTGSVSRVTLEGNVTQMLTGIIDSQSEHQVNDIKLGPDGRMYLTVGAAGNAGVVSNELAPWLMESPELQPRPCEDIVLRGHNFQTPDPLTENGDSVLTGAFSPFGTPTEPGETISGTTKCGGSILVFDPNDAEGSLEVYAWGFRNPIGLAWNDETGTMYMAENGYDIRGARPVNDEFDATLEVVEGTWYGIPDFSAAREPLTEDKFESPDSLQAPIFEGTERLGQFLDFVIDHEASGLSAPDPELVVGFHEVNTSPSLLDVAPASWNEFQGHLFIAEWGDLAPPTTPLREEPVGYRVVRVDPNNGTAVPFVHNQQPGGAADQGARGEGIERPFDVKFGPDDAMYIVDYGEVSIDMDRMPPYAYQEGTGSIWRVTRTD